MKTILKLLVTAGVAFGLTKILTGVHIDNFMTAIVFALVLGLLNFFVKPVLKIIGLPFTIITLGLFTFVINAAIILIAAHFIDEMSVDGFFWALIFSIALSLISSLINGIFLSDDKD
ncbi:phage holin family protein [Frigoriflavimonas asaccharolytica]|uniref:Putative membrane protein n=1 Tax=Frigoriflavimonas asaccharolytica TaxID=2735899 RepID=A0A8J8KBZ7_9FLAO|nr:phage holin family protein [Frigoriflavimonas asaccharolytica]NRS93079.1 putative membrane protein [Frigoriflavimonas asaccharolytica]